MEMTFNNRPPYHAAIIDLNAITTTGGGSPGNQYSFKGRAYKKLGRFFPPMDIPCLAIAQMQQRLTDFLSERRFG